MASDTLVGKVSFAIQLLMAYEPPEGFYFADSGGKDSSMLRHILTRARVKFDGHYCVSPIDPPQIRAFLKQYHPDTQWDYHARGFWKMVRKKGLPMRHIRWCCQVIKEAGGENRIVVLGNRRAEGSSRNDQLYIDYDNARNKQILRPILDFDNSDVWQYIRENSIPYCYLYDEGAERKGYGEGIFKRLGCVLCPFSRSIEREEQYFPKIVSLWKLACTHQVEAVKARGYLTKRGKPVKRRFNTGEELYQWWVSRS